MKKSNLAVTGDCARKLFRPAGLGAEKHRSAIEIR